MARVCSLSGKKAMTGHKVSHANNKTNRKFEVNLQKVSFLSDILKTSIQIRMSVNTVRCIEKCGGLDNYLKSASYSLLTPKMKRLKKTIEAKYAASVANA